MLKISVLASSSAANCTFVGTEHTRLLIDAGLSRKETLARLAAIGEDAGQLDAILITHEHSDHVCGLVALAKALKIPVFVTHGTARCLDWKGTQANVQEFQAGAGLVIGDIEIDSFTIPHDAMDPVGYCFRAQGLKAGIATDLGYLPDSIQIHLQGAQWVLLESNHDLDMLKVGPYPWSIKQRVMSRKGHLSNDRVAEYIRQTFDGATGILVLGHLSEHNNHPAIVEQTARQALAERCLKTRLVVAEPRRPSETFLF